MAKSFRCEIGPAVGFKRAAPTPTPTHLFNLHLSDNMSENATETYPRDSTPIGLGFESTLTQKFASASLRHAFLVPLVLAINIYFRRSFAISKHGLQLLVCLVVFGLGLRPEVREAFRDENCEYFFQL